MKWKMVRLKTIKITRAATTPRHGLEHYCRDLNSWPRSWMGQRSAARRAVGEVVPSVPGTPGYVECVAKDDPEARRQLAGLRPRVLHRTQQHAFAQKGAYGWSQVAILMGVAGLTDEAALVANGNLIVA